MIKRILVPIDFSDYSLNACYFAAHLAARHNAGIKLFHAFFNPMLDAMAFPDTFTYQSNMADIFQELEQNAQVEMNKLFRKLKRYVKLRNLEKVTIETGVEAGQPWEEIENTIKTYKPDVIIIGTRGHGEQTSEVLGSVAAKVIDSAGIPVLLVTQDTSLKEDEQLRILYATNFDESDYQAIQSLIEILSTFSIKIECVHFNTGGNRQGDKDKMSEMKNQFIVKYKDIPLECHIIESEDIIEGLNAFVESHDIDLIALTHKKRNMFYRILNPSLAKKLLFQTKRPVFVFN